MREILALMGACALLVAPSLVAAQTPPRAPLVQRRVVINFDEDVIESRGQGPLLTMMSAPQRAGHPSTIKVRERFTRQVLLSVSDL
jgi:hypothetical protein